jgi:hypothetical protein
MSKFIEGYDKYEITEEGEVFSHKYKKPKKLKPQPASQSKKGYLQVRLYDNSGKLGKLQYVHRLVYETFVGKIPEGLEIDHMDSNPRNNSLSNLQLLSRRGNTDKYNRKKHKILLRDHRDELIQDYETLGSFKKVAKEWGVSITAVNRVIRNRVHTRVDGKYTTKTYDNNINDEWSI